MKRRVVLSGYCFATSAIIIALLCGISVYVAKQPDHIVPLILLCVIIIGLVVATLIYMPLTVSEDGSNLCIRRPLRSKRIPVSEISSVKLCQPTVAEKRICGSGGFFGWYGWFSEKDLGKYFAYYGKASDCFLVTLKSGKKYMLGCEDAPEMVKRINELL